LGWLREMPESGIRGICMIKLCFYRVWVGLCFVLLMGCSSDRLLMPTPNLYAEANVPLFNKLHKKLEDTQVELIYVTDRVPIKDAAGNLAYGYGRSNSLSIGTTVVDLGVNASWAQLVEASRTRSRVNSFKLKMVSTSEITRLPSTPTPYRIVGRKVIEDGRVSAARRKSLALLRKEVKRRLRLTPRKDVYLYIHGYNNTFQDAAFAMGELWHFLGREGLPIIYTWPAGYPGLFGYTYDRESSEFTVFHLKETIKWLSSLPEVKNIHIIAHSRGADVAVSAFRELVIAARGSRISARKRYKVKNMILAAPDLDIQVVSQRITAEFLGHEVDQATIYSSDGDQAIGIAERLFSSPRGRLGTLDFNDLTAEEVAIVESNSKRITFVQFEGKKVRTEAFGHSYFRTNPAVSSDIVLLLRYGLKAGNLGRPLVRVGKSFWKIPSGYPLNAHKFQTAKKLVPK